MGIFDKVSEKAVKEAQYFERGNYVKPGTYQVEVMKVKEGTMRAPKNTGFFVAEMKVMESSDTKAHPIGSTMTWMSTADKDAFLGNVKHFVGAAAQIPQDDVSLDDLKMSVSEANPLGGVILQVDAITIKTKAEKDFTKCRFIFIADNREALSPEAAAG
jgi:hypothetical protein